MMRSTVTKVAAALVGAAALSLGAAAPAMASSGSGTQHTGFTDCDASGCVFVNDLYHEVTTPSGNTITREKLIDGVTGDGILLVNDQQGHDLTKDGRLQQSSYSSSSTITIAGVISCSASERTVYANGADRVDRSSSGCN